MRIMRSVLVIYILVSGICYIQAAAEEEHLARGLLIFLDNSERQHLGAVSDDLLGALSDKAGPILASISLIQNLFSEYDKDISDPSYGDIFNDLTNTAQSQKNTMLTILFKKLEEINSLDINQYQKEYAAKKYILLQALNFNPDQWIIKKLSNDLCLFIPIRYLEEHNINTQDVQRDNSSNDPSDIELKLGLRVNHMQTATIDDLLKTNPQPEDPNYFIKALYNEQLKTSSLFCLYHEYKKRSYNKAVPAWTIFMTGHGGIKIAGLSKEDFKKTLDFLEHKILCSLLVYSSCYSAGVNIEAVYKETAQDLQITYSFPIIMYALTDAPVFDIISPTVELDAQNNLILSSGKDHSFAEFLQAAENIDETLDYQDIMEHIFSFEFNQDPNEAPQIKLPGLAWFSVIDTDNIVGIGHILAKSRDPHLGLNIATFFNKDPYLILLYTPNIPFELHLNNNAQAIVSMIPGDEIHTLTKVSSNYISADKILETFMKIDTLKFHKIFFIKEITDKDKTIRDALIVYNQIPATERSKKQYLCTGYYADGQTIYIKKSAQDTPEKASDNEVITYLEYIEHISKQTPIENTKGSLLPITIKQPDIEKIKSVFAEKLLYFTKGWKRKRISTLDKPSKHQKIKEESLFH